MNRAVVFVLGLLVGVVFGLVVSRESPASGPGFVTPPKKHEQPVETSSSSEPRRREPSDVKTEDQGLAPRVGKLEAMLSETEAELADAKFRKVLVDKALIQFLAKPGETLSETLNRCLRDHQNQALQEAIASWMYTGMDSAAVAIDSAFETVEGNFTGGGMLAAARLVAAYEAEIDVDRVGGLFETKEFPFNFSPAIVFCEMGDESYLLKWLDQAFYQVARGNHVGAVVMRCDLYPRVEMRDILERVIQGNSAYVDDAQKVLEVLKTMGPK